MNAAHHIDAALLMACWVGAVGVAVVWPWGGGRLRRSISAAVSTVLMLASGAAWVWRWRLAGHIPVFGTYESALSLSFAVCGVAWWWELRRGFATGLTAVCGAVAGVVLLHGLRYNPTAYALTISERSWVVDVHAVVAWLAFGVLAANAGFGVLARWAPRDVSMEVGAALNSTLQIGFLFHSLMLATGSVYKFMLFGQAWSFDPIETMGLVAWLAYGTLLHMHLFAGWSGRRLGAWCAALFLILFVSYRGIVHFPAWATYHIFDMDLRLHVGG